MYIINLSTENDLIEATNSRFSSYETKDESIFTVVLLKLEEKNIKPIGARKSFSSSKTVLFF